MSVFDSLKQRIEGKDIIAGVIGLGYVGLPLANAICTQGVTTYGLDIDQEKIDFIERGQSYIDAVPAENIEKWYSSGLLKASTDFSLLKDVDFIVICVPTPLKDNNEPDLSYVEKTTEVIAKHLRPGQIIILESTTYPGTMAEVVKPILDKTDLVYEKDFHLAYSPERENPGAKNYTTSSIPKVIGADNDEALQLSKAFYEIFIDEMVPVSSMAVAEATKIVENVFRSVNIALVNELKVIFEQMDIDVWEVIEAASTKPFGFMPFYPGPGLGGHCIPIDPFYLSWKAQQLGVGTRFIELAGEINTSMPTYVFDKTKAAIKDVLDKDLKDSKILIMGIAYKKNVNDQRETPAFPIISAFLESGADISFYDPHIPSVKANRQFPNLTSMDSITWDEGALKSYDCAVIITDHDNVDYGALLEAECLLIDTRNIFKDHAGPLIKKA